MSTLVVNNLKSSTTNPPQVLNSAGTQIGDFARAWVNFNGTGVVAIRSSFNVSSITDNGTGNYTVNFTNAMQDANYATIASTGMNYTLRQVCLVTPNSSYTSATEVAPTASAVTLQTLDNQAAFDSKYIFCGIFR